MTTRAAASAASARPSVPTGSSRATRWCPRAGVGRSTRSRPPSASTRSRRLVSPCSVRPFVDEPGAVVADHEGQLARSPRTARPRRCARSGVLDDVGQRLADHEVRRGLDVGVEPPLAQRRRRRAPRTVEREPGGPRLDRRHQAAVGSTGGWMPWASSRRSASRSRGVGLQLGERIVGVARRGRAGCGPAGASSISATTSCCTPSWMSRSIRRRSASGAATIRARDRASSASRSASCGGQPNVGDRRRRLPGQRGEQLPVRRRRTRRAWARTRSARRPRRRAELPTDPRLRPAPVTRSAHREPVARARAGTPAPTPRPGRAGPCRPAGAAGRRASTVCSSRRRTRQQPVAVDPLAEHPPVGQPLQPATQRLEGQGGETVSSTASSTGIWLPNARPGAAVSSPSCSCPRACPATPRASR